LEGGPPGFSQSFSIPPAYSGTRTTQIEKLALTGLSPSAVDRSRSLLLRSRFMRDISVRALQPRPTSGPVWANPLSLAATYGISFDFSSSRYLDVSVPWVGSLSRVTEYYSRRVSPFGHPWIKVSVQLPMAFRSLPRPSSPVRA
jgi:hypothetical protein